jgi:hypothetical protein
MNVFSRIARKVTTIKGDLNRLRHYERFVKLGHFYSPMIDFGENEKALHKKILSRPVLDIDFNIEAQKTFLEKMIDLKNQIPWQETAKENFYYYFGNRNFAHSDAITYFSMLLTVKPKQVIEVGSGFSSCVLVDTNKNFLNSAIKKTFIEPYPALLRKLLKDDLNESELIPTNLQDVDPSFFESLNADDFLFIDSTHVSKFGSDVNYILFEILPRLKKGVIIHFHDVFNNFEYPEEWLSKGRNWNEDYILRAFLMNNNSYKILYFNHMMYEHYREKYENELPMAAKNSGGSIWLQKVK